MGKALDGMKAFWAFVSLDGAVSKVIFVIAQHSLAGAERLDKHVFADTYMTNGSFIPW